MTGLLSSISGHFTKALILRALFPAVIFVVLWLLAVAPLLPPDLSPAVPRSLGKEWDATSLTFVTLVLTALLYSLDSPLIRFYEGYPWKESFFGRWLTRMQRADLAEERRRAAVLFEVTGVPGHPENDRLLAAWSRTMRRINLDFPGAEDLVLPTRLGNVLRSFEYYPVWQYDMDIIHFWPRLVAVIPSGYAATIDDARTSLVFLLHLSFLSAVLAVAVTAAGTCYLPPEPLTHVLLPAVGFALLSCWLYNLSLGPARTWGQLVKGAVDLYRWDLLAKLGHEQKPRTRTAERALWSDITQQGMYGDRWIDVRERRPRVDYVDASALRPRTGARGYPEDVQLEVSRGVGPARRSRIEVVVAVANVDAAGRDAEDVWVTDTLPEGMEYVWGSAVVDGGPAKAAGTNPYRFHLGSVQSGATAILTYAAIVPSMHTQRG